MEGSRLKRLPFLLKKVIIRIIITALERKDYEISDTAGWNEDP